MTFLEIAQEVLDYTKRPDSSLPQAKREVNRALLWAQRRHTFEYSKLAANYTYKANSETVQLNEVAGFTIPQSGRPYYIVTTEPGVTLSPDIAGLIFRFHGILLHPEYIAYPPVGDPLNLRYDYGTKRYTISSPSMLYQNFWHNTTPEVIEGEYETTSGAGGKLTLKEYVSPNKRFRSLIGVEIHGKPIPLISQEVLLDKAKSYNDKHSACAGRSYAEFSRSHYGRVGYIKSGSNFGLFPKPQEDVDIKVYMSTWLPELKEDDDTNFLLEFGSDLILFRALLSFNSFLKADDRLEINYSLVNDAWNSLMQWDSDLTSSLGI